MQKKYKIWLMVVIAAILAMRFSTIDITMFDGDEGLSVIMGNEIAAGNLPYRDAIEHKGPGTYYLYGLIFWLFGQFNLTAVHSVFNVMVAIIAIILFQICMHFNKPRAGVFTVFLYAILTWCHPPRDMWAAHTEWPLILFTSLGVLLFLKALDSSKKFFWILCGMSFSFAALSKQIAAFDFIAVLCILTYIYLIDRRNLKLLIHRYLLLGVGFVVPFVCWFAYFAYRGALADFIFYTWTYNMKYYMLDTSMTTRIEMLPKFLYRFYQGKVLFLAVAIAGVFYALRVAFANHSGVKKPMRYFLFFLCLWNVFSTLGGAWGGRPFLHYLIQMIPSVSLLGGMFLGYLFEQIEKSSHELTAKVSIKEFMIILIILGTLAPLISTLIHYFPLAHSTDRSYHALAQHIQGNSEEDDTIFVWGFDPEIYTYARRMPATRYQFCNMLVGIIPNRTEYLSSLANANIVPGTWEILMRELKESMPKFIIDTSPSNMKGYANFPIANYPHLRNFLEKYYVLDPDFELNKYYPLKPVFVRK